MEAAWDQTRDSLLRAATLLDIFEHYRESVDCLPNLQLLSGVENVEKQAKLPTEWLANAFPKPEQRATYLRDNDLDGVSLDIGDFLDFYDQRKERMRQRLLKALGVTSIDPMD
ncbi:MAG: hypothetical protein ACRDP7_46900 [Trebonia sp.]